MPRVARHRVWGRAQYELFALRTQVWSNRRLTRPAAARSRPSVAGCIRVGSIGESWRGSFVFFSPARHSSPGFRRDRHDLRAVGDDDSGEHGRRDRGSWTRLHPDRRLGRLPNSVLGRRRAAENGRLVVGYRL